MTRREKEAVVEAVLFAMGEPVSLEKLSAAILEDKEQTRILMEDLREKYQRDGHGIQIIELNGAFQFATKPQMYEPLSRVVQVPQKYVLTDVLLETLSIIAYRQPVTRIEVEQIRGVKCDHVIYKLMEYDLIEEVGRLDAPGRPLLFGTTEEFLRHFGVEDIESLPQMDADQKIDFKLEAEEEIRQKLGIIEEPEEGVEEETELLADESIEVEKTRVSDEGVEEEIELTSEETQDTE